MEGHYVIERLLGLTPKILCFLPKSRHVTETAFMYGLSRKPSSSPDVFFQVL